MKAILVLDMPSSCDKCPLFGSHYSDMTCRANGRSINYPYPKEVRQDWCPLKPIPSKKSTIGKESDNDILCMNAGYNACIDEVLGDKE